MGRLLALAPLALAACAHRMPAEPAPTSVRGLAVTLRAALDEFRSGESIVLEFELRNDGDAPARFVPPRLWDRRYPWHQSHFDESEALLVIERIETGAKHAVTSASG